MRAPAADRARALLTGPLVSRVFAPAAAGTVTTFVIHRLAGPPGAGDADDRLPAELVRSALLRLRADGYRFVGLDQVLAAGPDAAGLGRRLVALTADDGYADQADVLAPLVLDLGIPLTIFLTTAFVDGRMVNWWDRVGHAINTSPRDRVKVTAGATSLDLELYSSASRREAVYQVLELGKAVPDEERAALVDAVESASGVQIPSTPFGPFRPLTWDDARRLEATGLVRFGPHSVTHPILARVDGTRVAEEVETSWRRLTEELTRPLPVFCYPNGEAGDQGRREVEAVRAAGLRAAVTVDGRHTVLADLDDEERRYLLGRIPFPDSVGKVVQRASGIDHLRWRARVRLGRRVGRR